MIWWGVERNGAVQRVFDSAEAFRAERLIREEGYDEARACVSADEGETWVRVPMTSTVRPDPAPPRSPRRVPVGDVLGRGGPWWARVLARWGRHRSPFGRRRV